MFEKQLVICHQLSHFQLARVVTQQLGALAASASISSGSAQVRDKAIAEVAISETASRATAVRRDDGGISIHGYLVSDHGRRWQLSAAHDVCTSVGKRA